MKYLIRKKGNKQKAHIWMDGEQDTACRMWSTGGINQNRKYEHHDTTNGKDVCMMCVNNAR